MAEPLTEPQSLSFSFVEDLEVLDPEWPGEFQVFDETITTNSLCDACGYVYSGGETDGVKKCPKCGVRDSGGPQVMTDDVWRDEEGAEHGEA